MTQRAGLVATAPVRIADIGGWTDTWYAANGRVCNIAVEPGAVLHLDWLGDGNSPSKDSVRLEVGADSYDLVPGDGPDVHPLLEAAVAALPPPSAIRLTVGAEVPPGSGLGTSASVVVAVLAVLRAARGESVDPASLAAHAHRIETGLGWETGVQDQWAAAFGGISDLDVRYPDVERRSVTISSHTARRLQERLVTIYLGHPHASSETHKTVISHLGDVGDSSPFGALRRCAATAVAALTGGDLEAYASTMTAATEAMRAIDPPLVSAAADHLIEVARSHGASGWKVNGAGGDGGTVTILGPAGVNPRARMCAALESAGDGHLISHTLATTGVRVVASAAPSEVHRRTGG